MNFFRNLTQSSDEQERQAVTETDSSPFEYLAERREQDSATSTETESARDRHERRFQGRVAAAKELEAWIRPLLSDLQEAAYPEDKVYGFIHWINHDDDSPWVILTPSLNYGPRHQDARADLIQWDTHPQPRIHWSIGNYPDHPYVEEQSWAFRRKVDVELLYENDRPHRLRISVGDRSGKSTECEPRLLDLTKALVQLHP